MVEFKANFREIHLLKGHRLGIGTYGAVFKAKCDSLICAAKILHPTLFNPAMQHQLAAERSRVAPIRKFEQECEFLSTIRHPNIVQYLGLSEDPDTGLPVLLMELMDENLTHFLHHGELCSADQQTGEIPFRIQVNICHDITLALSFLHSNKIIHRDLSSNNILLIGDVKAKLTDFGMATYALSQLTFTRSPGADVYMPPEAVWNDSPTYTEKIDCFSFGVLVVQILTRLPPKPGDRLKEMEVSGDMRDIRVSELERRHSHINKVDSKHPLLPIALDCLKDKGSERPSSKQLCERISVIKERAEYKEKVGKKEVVSGREESKCLQLKPDTYHQQETHKLRQRLEEMADKIREKDRIIKEVEAKLGHANQQLMMIEQVRTKFKSQFWDFDQQLDQIQKSQAIKLKWSEGERAPDKLFRWSNAVIHKSKVYVKFAGGVIIFQYNDAAGWSRLPNCPVGLCSMAVVNSLLTTIGGYGNNNYSDKLFSYESIVENEGNTGRWVEKFPPMPTKRNQTTSLCLDSEMALIVAGGQGQDDIMLKTVEVMNTETLQWSTAANLLEPQENASLSPCGDYLYMLGGLSYDSTISKSVFSYPRSAIFQRNPTDQWKKVADLPYASATGVSLRGHLLAIGGRESGNHSTCIRAVQKYNPIIDTWEEISYMSVGRSRCFAAVLPDDRLFIVGGWTGIHEHTDRVEIATLF